MEQKEEEGGEGGFLDKRKRGCMDRKVGVLKGGPQAV